MYDNNYIPIIAVEWPIWTFARPAGDRGLYKAIEISPKYANAYYNRGMPIRTWNFRQSIENYDKAIQLIRNINGHNNRGFVFAELEISAGDRGL